MLLVTVFVFGLALWLGLYLLARDVRQPLLRWAGLGLVAYAGVVALETLRLVAPSPDVAAELALWQRPLLLLPALFWSGALLALSPARPSPRWMPIAAAAVVVAGAFAPAAVYWGLMAAVLLGLFLAFFTAARAWQAHPRRPLGLILAATLFFGLSSGLLLLPFNLLPYTWLLLALSVDLVLLGLAVAVLDAFEQGEALLPDIFRSLTYSFVTALVFGGQVGLITLWTGATFPLVLLLLATVAAALVWQTFADSLQTAVDRIALARFPRARQARQELRTAASAVARSDDSLDLSALDADEFTRLTRRALSQMGNMPRLAASPLTRLPLVEARLAARDAPMDTLARAKELRSLLIESIERLQPRTGGSFGTSDAWRFYNALYFPYVAGLKPYSRRADHSDLDDETAVVLDWFRSQVPERTLYNWQNAAAELVAQQIREREA